MEATAASPDIAELQRAIERANAALIECHELFKVIARADLEGGGEVCILTLANIGARIADDTTSTV